MFSRKKSYTDSVIVNEKQVSITDLKKKAKWANIRFWSIGVSAALIGSTVLPYMSIAATVATSGSQVFNGEVIPGYSMGGIKLSAYGVQPNSWARINDTKVVGSTFGVWSGSRLDAARKNINTGELVQTDEETGEALNLSSEDRSKGWGQITGRSSYSLSKPNGYDANESKNTSTDNVAPVRTVQDYNFWRGLGPNSGGNGSANITVSLYPDFIIVNCDKSGKARMLTSPDEIAVDTAKDDLADGTVQSIPYYVPLSALFEKAKLFGADATIDKLTDYFSGEKGAEELGEVAKKSDLLNSKTLKVFYNNVNGDSKGRNASTAFNPYPYSMVFSTTTENGTVVSSIYNNSEAYVYFAPSSVYNQYIALKNEYESLRNKMSDGQSKQGGNIFQIGYYLAAMSILEAYLDEALPQDMTLGYVGPSETSPSAYEDTPGSGESKYQITETNNSISYASLMYDIAICTSAAEGQHWKQYETNAVMQTLSTFGYEQVSNNARDSKGTGVMQGLDCNGVYDRMTLFNPYWRSNADGTNDINTNEDPGAQTGAGLFVPVYYPIQQHKLPDSEKVYRFQILSSIPYSTLLRYIKKYNFAENVALTYTDADRPIEDFSNISAARNSVAALAKQYDEAAKNDSNDNYLLKKLNDGNTILQDTKKLEVFTTAAKDPEQISSEDTPELLKYRVESALLGYESGSMNSDNVHDLFDIIRATKKMKLETWYRFYNPIKSEGGDNDLFVTRVSPAATTYMPAMLMQGYTPAGGTNKSTDGSVTEGLEVANAFSPQNCAFDYFSIPSFAPCFAAHTAMETYYGVLNYELRPFYSEGLIKTLSKSANVPALPALEDFEKQVQKMNKETKKESKTLNKNIAAVYVMAKRVAYLKTCLALSSDSWSISADRIKELSDTYSFDGSGSDYESENYELESSENWRISHASGVNFYPVTGETPWKGDGTAADWWSDISTGGAWANFPIEPKDDDKTAAPRGDKPIPFTKPTSTFVQMTPSGADDADVLQIVCRTGTTGGPIQHTWTASGQNGTEKWEGVDSFDYTAHAGDPESSSYAATSTPLSEDFSTAVSQIRGSEYSGAGEWLCTNGDSTSTKYLYHVEEINSSGGTSTVKVRRSLLFSQEYEKQVNALLGEGGTYYWEKMEDIRDKILNSSSNYPQKDDGAPEYNNNEKYIHSARMATSIINELGLDNSTFDEIIAAYEDQLDKAAGEIGKAIVNLAKDYQLILDSMPTKMQNCLAWADYQTPSDSENQYQSDPSDANVTVNVSVDASDNGEKDYSDVKSQADLAKYGLVYDVKDKKIKLPDEKVSEDTSAESRMVRGVEGTTWFATNQPAEYTMSATIARINDLAANTSITFPYSGLYRGRLQSGTDRYATLQAHVIDYTSIASGIAGDLASRQRSQVVSLVEPQFTSITDFLDIVGLLGALFKEIGSAIIRIPAEAFSALMFGEGVNNTTVADESGGSGDSGATKGKSAMVSYITANGERMNRLPASHTTFNPTTGELEYGSITQTGDSGYTSVASNASAATMDRTSMVTSLSSFILTGLQPLYSSLQAFGLVLVMVFLGFIAFKNFFAYAVASNAAMLEAQTQLKVVIPRAIIAIFMIGLPPIGGGVGFEGGNFLVLRVISEIMAQIGAIFLGLNSGGVMDIFTNVDLVASFGADIGAYIIYLLACVILAICFLIGCGVLVVQALVLFFFYFFGPIVWALYIWPYNSESGSVTKGSSSESGTEQLARHTGNILPMITKRMNLGFYSGGRVGNLAPMGHIYNYTVIAGLTCIWAVMFWFVAMVFASVAGLQTSSAASGANAAVLASGYPTAASSAQAADLVGTMFGNVPAFVRILLATILAVLCFALMAYLLFNELKKQFENQKGILGAIGSAVAKGAQAGGGLLGRAGDAMDKRNELLANAGVSPEDVSRRNLHKAKKQKERLEAALAMPGLSDSEKAQTQKKLAQSKEQVKKLEDARKKYGEAKKQAAKNKILNSKPMQKARLATEGLGALASRDYKNLRELGDTISATGKAMENGQLMNALGNAAASINNKNLDRQIGSAKRRHNATQHALDAYNKLSNPDLPFDERAKILEDLTDEEKNILQRIGAGQNVNGKFVFNDNLRSDENGGKPHEAGLKQLSALNEQSAAQVKALEDKKDQNQRMYEKVLATAADAQAAPQDEKAAQRLAEKQAIANALGTASANAMQQQDIDQIKKKFKLEDNEDGTADEQAAKILADLEAYRDSEIKESNINSLMKAKNLSREDAVKALEAMDQNMVNVASKSVIRPLSKRLETLERGVQEVVEACRENENQVLSPAEAAKAAQAVCSGCPPCTKDEYVEIAQKLERGEDLTLRQTESFRAFKAACELSNMPLPTIERVNLAEETRSIYQEDREQLRAKVDNAAPTDLAKGLVTVTPGAKNPIKIKKSTQVLAGQYDMNDVAPTIRDTVRQLGSSAFEGVEASIPAETSQQVGGQVMEQLMTTLNPSGEMTVSGFMSKIQDHATETGIANLVNQVDFGEAGAALTHEEKTAVVCNSMATLATTVTGATMQHHYQSELDNIDKGLAARDEIREARIQTVGAGQHMMTQLSQSLPSNLMDCVRQSLPEAETVTAADFVSIANGTKPDGIDDAGWDMIKRAIDSNLDDALVCESAKKQTTILNSKHQEAVEQFDKNPGQLLTTSQLNVLDDISDDYDYHALGNQESAETLLQVREYNKNHVGKEIDLDVATIKGVQAYAPYVQDGIAPALFENKVKREAEEVGVAGLIQTGELHKCFADVDDDKKALLTSKLDTTQDCLAVIKACGLPELDQNSDVTETEYAGFIQAAYGEFTAMRAAESLHADSDYSFGLSPKEMAIRAKDRQRDLNASK